MKRIITTAVSLGLSAALLMGCMSGVQNTGVGDAFEDLKYGDTYPIDTDKKLTYYVYMYDSLKTEYLTRNETPLAEYLKESTGIEVEFIHPTEGTSGGPTEFFNLMIASNDLPDIMEAGWMSEYKGGAQAAIDDGVIISLNEAIDVASPNLKAYYSENPDAVKLMKTDEDNFFMYPFIRGDDLLMTFMGPMVRQDLLDKVGLSMPETVAEWDEVLRAFKDTGVKTPITLRIDDHVTMENTGDFLGAFGIMYSFYVDNGVVKYGAYEPAFKEYVELLRGWFADGLLDQDAATHDSKRLTAEVVGGNVGAAFATAGGGFGAWANAMKDSLPEADFQPASYPVMNKGDMPFYGQKDFPVTPTGAAISTKCEDPELAARFLDFGYSDEGRLLYNFGREGVSYTMVNGVPTYADIVMDYEKNGNVSIGHAIGRHARAMNVGPFIQDRNYLLQFYAMDFQRRAVDVWSRTNAHEHKMPYLSLTEDESIENTSIMRDITTFRQEAFVKYVCGLEDMSTFDNFYAELQKMGIERAIEIQQAAYDRYLSR